MDVESAEVSRSLLQIVQMKLVRRARYCAPIAAGKRETAEGCSHLAFYDISSRCCGATGAGPITPATWPRLPFLRNVYSFESNLLSAASDMCSLKGLRRA